MYFILNTNNLQPITKPLSLESQASNDAIVSH